jgi:hypothetical protein
MAKPITGVQQRCILLTLALLEPPACGVTRKTLREFRRLPVWGSVRSQKGHRSCAPLTVRRKPSKLGFNEERAPLISLLRKANEAGLGPYYYVRKGEPHTVERAELLLSRSEC